MGSKNDSVFRFIEDINENLFLPAIQRDFVWDKDQIILLFDSLLRGYPIGSLLLWSSEIKSDTHILYELLADAATAYNPPQGSTSRPQQVNQGVIKELQGDPVRLILDGQQRLTSLLIGLDGSLNEKNGAGWSGKQKMYVNLLSGRGEETYDGGTKYEFRFSEDHPTINADRLWFRLGRLLQYSDRDNLKTLENELDSELEEALKSEDRDEEYFRKRKVFRDNLSDFYRELTDNSRIQYFEENTDNHSKVLDIFIRTNDGGTELDHEEILLSILTDKWSQSDTLNAKEEINSFLDSVRREFDDDGIKLKMKTIIRAIGMFVGLSRGFEMNEFKDHHINRSKEIWTEGEIQTAFRRAIRLLIEFGFTEKRQVSPNLLVPLAYFFFKNPHVDTTGSKIGKDNRRRIHYWVCSSVLNEKIKQRETVVNKIMKIIREESDSSKDIRFPLEEISKVSSGGYSLKLNENNLKRHFDRSNAKNSTPAYAVLSLMYYSRTTMADYEHIDHIFPQSKMKREVLEEEFGVDAAVAVRMEDHRNNLANLQVLSREDNQRKADKLPSEWFETRPSEYFDINCIPTDEDLWKVEQFQTFLEKRTAIIIEHIIEKTENQVNRLTY